MTAYQRPEALRELPPLIGESPAIRLAREVIEIYAPTRQHVLVAGATGTGKELIAHHVHTRSRCRGRLVPVNCAALPRELAESLLFGHQRGAFSGAVAAHRGHVACADAGTLFLDELLSLPADGQAKLLRALDTGEVQPLGAERPFYIDLRVVAAIQDDSLAGNATNPLRRDLLHRVADVVIHLPPLRDRPDDLIPLARHFAGQQGQRLTTDAERVLLGHPWPGNVRELRKVMQSAGTLVADGVLPATACARAIALGASRGTRADGVESYGLPPREDLIAMCKASGWSAPRVAQSLGLPRSTLYWRLKRAGLTLRALRAAAASNSSNGRLLDGVGRTPQLAP